MSADNSRAGTWGQLMVAPGTEAGQRRALPPDTEAHIRAITAPDSKEIPPETQQWLKAKLQEYVNGQRRLDEVMNLAPSPSQRDWRTIDRLDTRNAWLVRAFDLIDGTSEYKRCCALSEHIHTFEEVFWPGLRGAALPPEDSTPLRRALFFAFKFAPSGEVPHGWVRLKEIVQNPPPASGTYPILWHIHADAYDQPRSTTTINPPIHIGKSHMNILQKLSLLTLHAWQNSPEVQARHYDDLSDYHARILRQAMDCDDEKGELPPLITDVLSKEQIEEILKPYEGVNSL
ncbi:hypothetical protein SAMN05216386_1651 [Nitrosospira briensis]|uniref:Uncharacterized protein n=1 Tax=Nitrosospira briensis TaxID=35799 RepID=A0A1I5B3R5_9PROT|nr:hypothetical protein [Nitrosospira briensis]SFN69337.1 hypothetical protein SAMN05216386_1651 [Nitrosospira briensis]